MAAITILNILFIFIFYRAVAQQANSSRIALGSSLNTNGNSYWTSKSGRFAFGFYPEGNSSYVVCVWLQGVQQQTVIWTANRDDPPISGDASLILRADGIFVQQEQGQKVILDGVSANSAFMLDTGNFVLYNSSSEIVWQTFSFPTDTIISGQTLLSGNQLVSSISETDHRSGGFTLIMQTDGNLVQYPAKVTPTPPLAYWNSTTYLAGKSTVLNLDTNGSLYLKNDNGTVMNLTGPQNVSAGTAIYRATIDADGIFRLYSLDLNGNGNWSIRWHASTNKCDPIGNCGFNGYCTLGQDEEPVCNCPPGFDFIDEKQKNLGCKRNTNADNCSNVTTQEVYAASFLDNPYSVISVATKDQCGEECKNDYNCDAAMYMQGQCSKQSLPLRYIAKSGGAVTWIKVYTGCQGTKPGEGKRKEVLRTGIFITGIASSALASFFLATVGFLIIYRYRVYKYRKILSKPNDELLEDVALRSYTYDELKTATNNFMNEIGKGGFGTVFRGELSDGNRIVAIKRLEIVMADGEREFRNEMRVIGRTHHKNLVRLLGYCHEGTNRLLVYEYMNNGSLADFLFKSERKPMWEERIEIATNVARGLAYLHEECATQIIHCDIKPENILMDENECPKIADFGLSKLLMPNQSKTYTGLRGTRGYVAPEWHRNMPITVKADVYSFGIMLLEIICCRRSVDMDVSEHKAVLAYWVYDCFVAGEVNELVVDEEVETSSLDRMVRVGLWCLQDEASLRPSMKKVLLMLEGTIDIPAPPNPPSFGSSI